jgi:uncharacterized LabA/DUF88 family protein
MADYIYIDDSNLYIEGRRVSAVSKGLASNINEAMDQGILDQAYTIGFGLLHEFLTGGDLSGIKRVALFGSTPPPNDSIWVIAKRAGFELHLEERNFQNKEKKIDTGIATMMTRDAYKFGNPKEDVFVLVAGDRDYVPTVNTLRGDGFEVEVAFWDHASPELRKAASKFTSLNAHLESLRLK